MNEIKHFRFWAKYSTEWPVKYPVGWAHWALMGKYQDKNLPGKKTKWKPLKIIFCFLLLVTTYILSHTEPWCVFLEEDIFCLWSCLKNMVLISSKSLKSYYKDLRSPLIFIEPKFSKIFIKILKRFLKVFGLFISVKK